MYQKTFKMENSFLAIFDKIWPEPYTIDWNDGFTYRQQTFIIMHQNKS